MLNVPPNPNNSPNDPPQNQVGTPNNPLSANPPQNQVGGAPNNPPNSPNPPQNQTGTPNNPPPAPLTPPQDQTIPAIPANAISTTSGNDSITGDSSDNFFIGSSGNDTINGGSGTDTVSYLSLSSGIILQAQGVVNKGALGTDLLQSIEHITAPLGQINTIDSSTGTGTASITANLSTNSISVNNIPGIGTLSFVVDNFTNIKGTANADSITGNVGDNYLVGGAGNDFISGFGGNDTLIGVDPTSATPGSNETDTLIGGQGRDLFVLGDALNTYYQGAGSAIINNFEQGIDRIQLRGSLSDYRIVGNSIVLANNPSDTIATIQGNFNPNSFTFV